MSRVTIACPESLIHDANQLASCLGLGPDDSKTYSETNLWLDQNGNKYSVVSAVVSEKFFEMASVGLIEPEWGADIVAASRAQFAFEIHDISVYNEESVDMTAKPDKIIVMIGEDVPYAISLLNVSRNTSEEIISQENTNGILE